MRCLQFNLYLNQSNPNIANSFHRILALYSHFRPSVCRHKRDIFYKGKNNISLKKKESRNLSHQINEFAEFTLSSFWWMIMWGKKWRLLMGSSNQIKENLLWRRWSNTNQHWIYSAAFWIMLENLSKKGQRFRRI